MPLAAASRLCIIHPQITLGGTESLTCVSKFGQELLSTFGTQIGEIALIPATGGLFSVELVCFSLVRVNTCMANDLSRHISLLQRKGRLLKQKKCCFGIGRRKAVSQVCLDIFGQARSMGR